MKTRFVSFILAAALVLGFSAAPAQAQKYVRKTLRIGTYNIQYPNVKGHAWPTRIPALRTLLLDAQYDAFGVQEPFPFQIDSIMAFLGPEYAWIGDSVYGDNTKTDWHFNVIFYKRSRLKLLDEGIVWFADEPGKPWLGATTPRMCKWGKFRDKKTHRIFYQFNCHFDHKALAAQKASAVKITEEARRIAGKYPYIISGDFNVTEDSEVYKMLAGSEGIQDSMLAVENPVNAQYFSWPQYKPLPEVPQNGKHFDHMFYSTSNSKVESWIQIVESAEGSDHYPILIEWRLAR